MENLVKLIIGIIKQIVVSGILAVIQNYIGKKLREVTSAATDAISAAGRLAKNSL